MDNKLFDTYEKYLNLLNENINDISSSKKLKGAIFAEIVREFIIDYFKSNAPQFSVSKPNSYIKGSKYEHDLIIYKSCANPILGIVFDSNDVVATIELKVGGLYDIDLDVQNISKAINDAVLLNEKINFGYLTLWENTPVNEIWKDKRTVNHWSLTNELLKTNVNANKVIIQALKIKRGTKKGIPNFVHEMSDEQFDEFINELIH